MNSGKLNIGATTQPLRQSHFNHIIMDAPLTGQAKAYKMQPHRSFVGEDRMFKKRRKQILTYRKFVNTCLGKPWGESASIKYLDGSIAGFRRPIIMSSEQLIEHGYITRPKTKKSSFIVEDMGDPGVSLWGRHTWTRPEKEKSTLEKLVSVFTESSIAKRFRKL